MFYALENRALSTTFSGRSFIAYQGKEWTYYQVYNEALIHGTWLKQKYNVVEGEVVALDFMNGPQFIFLWFGLWSIGAIPAFINYNLKGRSLVHAVTTSKARLCLLEEEISKTLDSDTLCALDARRTTSEVRSCKTVICDAGVCMDIAETSAIRAPDKVRGGVLPQSMAILIFTSGTTGFPKGAIVSWAKFIRSAELMAPVIGLKASDRYYGCMPLYHTTAAVLGLGCSLAAGSCFVIGRHFSLHSFWKEVRESRATAFQYVGETCRYLLTAPTELDPVTGLGLDKRHDVRLIFGNGLRPDVWEKFKDRFGIEEIVEFYGATEAPIGIWNVSRNSFSKEAVGRNGKILSLSLSLKAALVEVDRATDEPVRDPNNGNFCRNVSSGEAGEFLTKLDPNDPRVLFQGYYGNDRATDDKILRSVFKPGDAWFRFGDILRWDDEGRIFFVDRIGDTFRWKSENISPSEIAEAFEGIPHLLEVNAYGVQIPQHDGRAGCAAIQLQPDVSEHELVFTLRQAVTQLQRRLQRHAVPSFLRIVSILERTGTNKQTKAGLRAAGVDPNGLAPGESLWWFRNGEYVRFTSGDWDALNRGVAKL